MLNLQFLLRTSFHIPVPSILVLQNNTYLLPNTVRTLEFKKKINFRQAMHFFFHPCELELKFQKVCFIILIY